MELLKKLASGGMAEIWLARVGRELFAVKKLHLRNMAIESQRELFRKEQTLAPTVRHENLVRAYEATHVDGMPALLMELVEGETLGALRTALARQQRPVPVEVAAEILRRVALALHALHTRVDADGKPAGLVHCDVSPSNVLIARTGAVKVTDLGIAQPVGTTVGSFLGKPGYAAPEQYRGLPLDARTDLFSLGVMLFELVTGQRLFHSDDPVAALRQQLRLDVLKLSRPEHVPFGLWALMRALLQADPDLRPKNAAVVAAALGRIVKLRRLKRRPVFQQDVAVLFADAFPAWRSPRTPTGEFEVVPLQQLQIDVAEDARDRLPPPIADDAPTPSLPVLVGELLELVDEVEDDGLNELFGLIGARRKQVTRPPAPVLS